MILLRSNFKEKLEETLKAVVPILAEKFMHMQLAAEKEIIYIVTKTELKNSIMQAIMQHAGADTKAKAITFSLPVTATAGLRLIED